MVADTDSLAHQAPKRRAAARQLSLHRIARPVARPGIRALHHLNSSARLPYSSGSDAPHCRNAPHAWTA